MEQNVLREMHSNLPIIKCAHIFDRWKNKLNKKIDWENDSKYLKEIETQFLFYILDAID